MKKQWTGRVYLGRDESGKQQFEWVGRFDTKRERDAAVEEAKQRIRMGGDPELPTCDVYVDRYLADYERHNKATSHESQTQRLARFKKDFAGRSLDIRRDELKDWINAEGKYEGHDPVPIGYMPAIVSLYNHAIDEDDLPLDRNPARKLAQRTRGRADTPPPTAEEFERLLTACSVLKDYAPMMRALLRFAAFTLMRPGELYPLEWTDLDFKGMRISKARRLFRGQLDVPKTGEKVIALTPPARDAVLGLDRSGRYVFTSKTGRRLDQSKVSLYFREVCVAAGLDFEFYLATKHYGVHYMWTKLGMSDRAIAAQAGWKVSTVQKMLAVYGHGDVGALEEVDAAFAAASKAGEAHLRVVGGDA